MYWPSVCAAFGGVRRLAGICTVILPIFMVCYVGMCSWIIYVHADKLPQTLYTVVTSAFSGHAPIFGFAGSSALMALQFGMTMRLEQLFCQRLQQEYTKYRLS